MSETKSEDCVEDKNGKVLKVSDTVVFDNGEKAKVVWSEEHDRAYFNINETFIDVIFYSFIHDFEIVEV